MPILAANANVDNSGMGSVLASRGAGYLVANILGVILQNIVKKHSDGLLICAFILPAIGEIFFHLHRKRNFSFSGFCYSICNIIDINVCLIFYTRCWSRFYGFR
jgi:hypothetical protein